MGLEHDMRCDARRSMLYTRSIIHRSAARRAAQRSMADYYRRWDEACREGGVLDEEEEHRDIRERAGAYAGVEDGPVHDSFTFEQDKAGRYCARSYASAAEKNRHEALVARVTEADIAPGGREAEKAAKRFKESARAEKKWA